MTEINRRDLGLGLVGTIAASSLLTSSSIAAPAGVTDPFALVDPELLAAAKALPQTTINKAFLPMMRARPAVSYTHLTLPTSDLV